MTWTQSHDPVGYIHDLFPASVATSSGLSFPKTRAILLTQPSPRLLVFSDGPQGPRPVIDAVFDPSQVYGDSRTGFDVYAGLDPQSPRTASIVSIRPTGGCGCGSRLQNFRPFSVMRNSAPRPSAGPVPAPPLVPAGATV